MTISHAEREEARELYVIDGLTFEQVAGATGIAASTLQSWSNEEGWPEGRREYRESLREIRRNTVALRKKLIAEALESCDPQKVYAAVRLENVAARTAPKQQGVEPDIDRPRVFMEDMEFVAEVLKEIDPEGLKIFARHFETIIQRFKAARSS